MCIHVVTHIKEGLSLVTICACMNVCTCMYIYKCIYIYMYKCTPVNKYIYICMCTDLYACS